MEVPEELLPHSVENPDFNLLAYTPPEERGRLTFIDPAELEEARRDPRVRAFLEEARVLGEMLDRKDEKS